MGNSVVFNPIKIPNTQFSGVITESQLSDALKTKINLIDGLTTLSTSVNARIKTIQDTTTALSNSVAALTENVVTITSIYEINPSSPVIIKAAADAMSVGTYDTISLQGFKHQGNTTTKYGWFTVTRDGDNESSTATDTSSIPYLIETTKDSGVSGYAVNMYDRAEVASATLLNSQHIPVVYKGADGKAYLVVIESTNGTGFRTGQNAVTLLKAHVFLNGIEITNSINTGWFRWRRVSLTPKPIPNDDATWNNLYQTGYPQITINIDDVDANATFFCDIIDPNI